MTHRNGFVWLRVASLALVAAPFSLAHADDPKGPASVACHDKTFPNLEGENALVLTRDGATYSLVTQSYDKPKTTKKLVCSFHPSDARVFACKVGAVGFTSQKRNEIALDYSGKASTFDGYSFEGVKNPEGEPKTTLELRFPAANCTVKQ